MSLPLFADLYKPIKDALTKGYQGDSHKIEITTKDTVKFNPVFTRDVKGNYSGSLSVEGDYIPCKHANTKLKYGINEKGILSAKLTAENIKCPITKEKIIKVEGLADILVGGDIAKDKYELKCEAKHKKFACNANLKQDFTGEKAVVVGFKELQLGAQASFNVLSKTLTSHQVGAAYKVSPATTIAFILENLKSVKAGFASVNSKGWTFAGEYTAKLTDVSTSVVTLGSETTLKDGQTVKVRANTQGIIAASIAHKLSPELKLTSSVEVDTFKGYASKVGSQLVWDSA